MAPAEIKEMRNRRRELATKVRLMNGIESRRQGKEQKDIQSAFFELSPKIIWIKALESNPLTFLSLFAFALLNC